MLQQNELSPRHENPNPKDNLSHQKLQQLIEGFVITFKLQGMSPLTIDGHQRKLNRFLAYICEQSIEYILANIIRSFLSHIRDTYHLDNITLHRYLISLKVFYKWIIDEGFTTENPTAKIKLGRSTKKVVKGLSHDKITSLLNSLTDNNLEQVRNKVIVLVLLDCGLRVSELVNLKLTDIDLQRGVLTIIGKGSKQGITPIGLKTRKAIWRYTMLRGSSSNWLLVSQRNKQITRSGVQQILRKLDEKLGIMFYPHLLRHTFAISFLRNGVNAFECQYALGHSCLEMNRHYTQALSYKDILKKHEVASPVDNALKS